ncbi:MAG: general stress protein, partial [Kineosporiaceae bacterium]
MAFPGGARSGRVPRTPTLFRGEQIAVYDTYAEAQRAVDFLSDEKFPVQSVAIVGTDLRMVERVTGRLSYPRVALAGAASGAYLGLFFGLLLLLFGGEAGVNLFLAALLIGAGFGTIFGIISYSFTGGRRDFTSASQIVATQYALLSTPEVAGQARQVLQRLPGGPGRPPTAADPTTPPGGAPPVPPAPPP